MLKSLTITLPTQITKRHSASVSKVPVTSRLLIYLFVALVLCDRFRQATDMVHKTSSYYTQLSSTIPVRLRKKGVDEMTSGASGRPDDTSLMDIIGAQEVDLPT